MLNSKITNGSKQADKIFLLIIWKNGLFLTIVWPELQVRDYYCDRNPNSILVSTEDENVLINSSGNGNY